MKNVIREYLELDKKEKELLWRNAIFIFDTNVFLNLYRYSPNTREQLLNAFEQLKERVWMPYQVAYEFAKDRYDIIYESNQRFQSIRIEADKMVSNWKEQLRTDATDEDIDKLTEFLHDWVEQKEKKNQLITNPNEDSIFDKLLEIFDNRAGQPFGETELKEIEKEGELRYSNSIPPGYKDKKKIENKYGDLLVWKEILKYAKENKKDIIFVTHDQKEDWWNQRYGKTIGPRVELRKEFYDVTAQKFHMYSMSSFLSTFNENTGKTIDTATIDEIELLLKQKQQEEELKQYKDILDDEKAKRKEEFINEIARLEAKNRKRERVIANLNTERGKKHLSDKKKQFLENNERNLAKDKERIKELLIETTLL